MTTCRSITFSIAVLAGVLLLFAGMGAPDAFASEPVAKDARLGGDANRTRFVTVLSKNVKFGIRTLANPYRVIIDMSDVKLNFPAGRGKKGRGLVTGYRYGRVEPYGVRIILDVKSPVLVDKASIWPASNGQPPRLVVELVKTDRRTFMSKQAAQRKKRAAARPKNRSKAPAIPTPTRRKSASAKRVIVIDPGHGGIDPGAVAKSGLKEKEVVLAFSKTLKKKLEDSGRYKVLLTRSQDSYISLRKRVEFGRQKGADLFISVHADAIPGRNAKKVTGAGVYTLSEDASDEEAKALAAKENRSDIIAGIELPPESNDVTNILIDLAQRETKNLSISFADTLLSGISGKTTVRKKARRFAGFVVLKAPDVPSVLLELGFITNPSDARRLTSSAWRAKVATAVANAVDTYFARQMARKPF
ncbi:MAG: N-acetylmuramoyl-L-alanine amidase [Hyphomicrobiaceae bacterium]|nr:N-acetylmuramoyl-L-alanine amidase [Hyphomicrobiaceae bacterium]